MPRLRSKVLLKSDKNDSSIETTPNENKRKTRRQSESGDLFSISKLKNDEQMLTDESIEFVSLISPDLKTIESEEEIQTTNVFKHNKKKNSGTEGSEKENEIQNYKKRNNRKSIQNKSDFSNSDTESNRRQLRSRKSISKVDTTIDSDTAKQERSKKNNKNNLNSSDSDVETNGNFNKSHKTKKGRKSFINQEEDVILTLSDVSKSKNSNKGNVNTEIDSKNVKQKNESDKTVIGNKRKNNKGARKSTSLEVTDEVANQIDSNSDIEVNKIGSKKDKKFTRSHKNSSVQITDDETVNSDSNEIEVSKLKRSTQNNEVAEKSTHKDQKQEKEFEGKLNKSKSKVNRRSTRAQENSVAAVEDLITDDEDIKMKRSKLEVNRGSTRASKNSFEAPTNLVTDNENPMSENQDIDVKMNHSQLKVNRRSTRANENSFDAGNQSSSVNEKSKTENRENDAKIDENSFKTNRRSLRSNENSFDTDKDLVTESESGDMEIVGINLNRSKKDRRSTCIHEKSFEIVKDLIIHKVNKLENQGINLEVNGSISRKDRRSIRSNEENSFEAVNDLTIDSEDPKSEDQENDVEINRSRARTDRRSTRIHEASFEAVKDLIIDNKDTTFSPKSPKFDYQDTFTSNVHSRPMRKSKYETSTPAKSLISKSATKKTNLNITPANISLIDLTNFTPRSIIKKPARSIQNLTKSLEKKDIKSQVTLRKKRSISETDLTNIRKSRVTFHPNTSVFHMDSLDSTLDDSEISINIHSTSLIKESASKKSIDFVSINPLNDTYDMEALENQSADAIEGAHLSIKSNTPDIDGVQKLNETFTPEEDKSKVREIGKRIKIHEKQPLVTDSAAKRKVYKKTPKRLLNSSVGSGLKKNSNQEQTPVKIGTNNLQRNIKAAIDNNQLKINKSNVLNSLKKTPSTSSKNQPTPKRGTSTKKMPDFASIHKRNFEKMESLVENVKKRADRAKQLFTFVPEAGNKTTSNNIHNKPTRLPVPSNRLVSTTTAVKTPSKQNSLSKANVHNTPGKANIKNTPGKANIKNTPGKVNIKNTPGQTNLPKPVSRFGFGLQNAKDKKETLKEELKKKQPILGDIGTLRQKERQYVKGVRSNRRFDLLMKSRDCK